MEACYKSITSAILSPALCFSSVKSLSTSHPYSEATFIVTQCSKCITILSFPLELPNATCYPHLSMKHPHLQDALLPLVSFPSLFAFWTTHRKWPPPCPRACSYARCRLPSVPGTRQELNRGYFYFLNYIILFSIFVSTVLGGAPSFIPNVFIIRVPTT